MTEQTWTICGKLFSKANAERIKQLRDLPGAPHVMFACLCGKGHWTAKNIALSSDGGYNGTRNIFYNGDGPECSCSPSQLVCIDVQA